MTSLTAIALWGLFEYEFAAQRDYNNPFQNVTVQVVFTAPSGRTVPVDAFWDGGRVWRVRFSPDETGEWQWRTSAEPKDSGLDAQQGRFACVPYTGNNPLFRHGPVRLAEDRCSFVQADGTPFFWLGDTAWNGVLRATPEDWQRYLGTRARQGFTVIQFVCTQWRGGDKVLADRAFTGERDISINPEFFQRCDPMVRAINDHGMIASPVQLWALNESDPGSHLPLADAVRLARYIKARWGAHQVIWLLGGDGRYLKDPAYLERWLEIGRQVFAEPRDRLVTLHPCGLSWIDREFGQESWFDFVGYQSGHGDGDKDLRWLVEGPPARQWEAANKPVVNLEPNYEAHPAYQSRQPHNAHHVRRAAYWSLLVSPPAGITYGHNAIWVWNSEAGPAENHGNVGTVLPWDTGLRTEGIEGMTICSDFFAAGPFSRLRPAPGLLAEQPGQADPNQFVAAATTDTGDWTVLYLPAGGTVSLTEAKPGGVWFDPRTGHRYAAGDGPAYSAPDQRDWVLEFRPAP
jgi:hypothetical protein